MVRKFHLAKVAGNDVAYCSLFPLDLTEQPNAPIITHSKLYAIVLRSLVLYFSVRKAPAKVVSMREKKSLSTNIAELDQKS